MGNSNTDNILNEDYLKKVVRNKKKNYLTKEDKIEYDLKNDDC